MSTSLPLPPPPAPPRRLPWRRRRSAAWLRLCRPLSTLAGVAVVLGFAMIAESGAPDGQRTLRLALAMAATLISAAAANDALDAGHDRDTRLWRPIPAGLISGEAALRLAAVAALVALALAASLGWRPFLLTLTGLALALTYSTSFKRTPFSWLPFAAAFALVPPWVFESLGRFDGVLWWAFAVGPLAGLTFHLAVKLPDYERDDAPGQRNLLHWLTIDYAIPFTWGVYAAYLAVAAASANLENLRWEWLVPTEALGLLLGLLFIGLLWGRVTERRLLWQRWAFACAVLAVALGWLGSITP